MSCSRNQYEFQIGGTACMPFSYVGVNGQPVDPDALPTLLNMTVNGDSVTPTAAQNVVIEQVEDTTPAAIVGEYQICFDPAGFSANDEIDFIITAAVGSVPLRVYRSALVKDVIAERPQAC